jgi:adenine/guanine phosphoribosyltransferase-like PRPP-binding protein
MSWRDCADAVRAAAGRELSDDQVADIFERAQARRQALEAEGRLDLLDDRLRDAVKADADALRVEAALARKHAALSVIARDRTVRHVTGLVDAGLSYAKAVEALLEGTMRGVAGGRASVNATRMAFEARYTGGMLARVVREVPHAEGMLRERAFLDDVVREMIELREGGTPGGTRNRDAATVARIFADAAEQSRRDLNRLGANIGKLDGWAGSQVHDGDKIAAVSKEEWVAAVLPRLDLARTFDGALDDAGAQRALGQVWENIVFQRERAGERPDPAGTGFRGPVNVARALERHRVLHFKSADDWLAYNERFGSGHIFDGMVGHQSRAALNASLMQVLGPNPGATLDAVLDTLRRRVDVDERIAPADKAGVKAKLSLVQGTRAEVAFRIASGAAMIPVNRTMADIGGTIRAWQALSKLGGASISAVGDLATAVVNLRFNGLSFGEAAGGQVREMLGGIGSGERRELAFLLGEGFDGMVGHMTSPYVAADGAPGVMQSLLVGFFRWTGLTWLQDAGRAGVARLLSANLGEAADKPLAELEPRVRHVLGLHGIDAATWDAVRAAGVREVNGRRYLVPDGLAEKIAAAMADREAGATLIRSNAPPRTPWPADFPQVVHHGINDIRSYARHGEAKAGDKGAAREVVGAIVKPARLEALRQQVAGQDVVLAFPAGRNAVPAAYAERVAEALGATLAPQRATGEGRTLAGAATRLGRRRTFEGEVVAGRAYLLVDDVVTQGGTLADLRAHIEAKGGRVVGATALQASGANARLAPDAALLAKLRAKSGEAETWWLDTFGAGWDTLTDSEARALLAYADAGAIRNAVAARQQRETAGMANRRREDAGFRAELALRRYFADEAMSAVLEADAAAQRWTTLGQARGTLAGEAARMLMQFKGFPIAFTQRVLGRAAFGGEGGRTAGAAHVGGLVAGLAVMGYVAMTAKDAIRGYEPRELVDKDGQPRLKTLLAALVQGGGAGIYGDFLFGEVNRIGNAPLENLAGPFASDAARWVRLAQQARDGDARAADALNATLGSTPFANVFYARPVLDYLILEALRDALSPGWRSRMDARRRKEFGQDPLVPASDRIAFDLF